MNTLFKELQEDADKGRALAALEPLQARQDIGEHVLHLIPGRRGGGWHRQRLHILVASLLVVGRGKERDGGEIEGKGGGEGGKGS